MSQSSSSVPLSLPPLAGLEAVRLVAREASLTAAAEKLGLTPGALSRRVAAVEAWLGTPLFERHGRGMRPTIAGQRFLLRIEDAFAMIESAADPWRGRRGPDVVRLSALSSLARFWLFDRLRALEEGGPGGVRLKADLSIESRLADVEAGEVDIALRYGRGDWRNLEARPFMSERLVPVAHPRLAEALGEEPDATALLAHPLLHDSEMTAWRAWLKPLGIRHFRPRPQDRRIEDYGLVLDAAAAGLGIALGRLPLARHAISASGLVALSRRESPSPLGHYLVTRRGESRPAVLDMVDRMLAAANSSN